MFARLHPPHVDGGGNYLTKGRTVSTLRAGRIFSRGLTLILSVGAPAMTGAEVTSDAGTFTRFGVTGLRLAQFVSATADSAPGTARFAERAGGALGRTVTFTADGRL